MCCPIAIAEEVFMKAIEYKGKTYKSIKALHSENTEEGISYACFNQRIKLGWDIERALITPADKITDGPYVVESGLEFPTLRELARAAGISYDAAVKRSHRGFSVYEIFYGKEKPKRENVVKFKAKGRPITIEGITYPNLKAAYDAIKPSFTYNAVRARCRQGWTVEQALGVEAKVDGRRSPEKMVLLLIGSENLSIMEASERYQVPYATIHDRIKRGATPEQAVGLEPIPKGELKTRSLVDAGRKKRIEKTYKVDGVHYRNVADLAKAFGLARDLVYNRLRINGWSPERAVKEPIPDCVKVNGTKYKSAMNAWDNIGKTSFATYQGRKRQGLPLEVCLGLAPLPQEDKYELKGKSYHSLKELAADYDLSVGQLSGRLQTMSLEEAVSYVPSNGRYTEARFRDDPELAATIGTLYFVKLHSMDRILHKVGITLKKVEQRLASVRFKLLAEFEGTLVGLHRVEQKVIKEFCNNLSRANEGFEGKTETFLLMDDEEAEMLAFLNTEMAKQGCMRKL